MIDLTLYRCGLTRPEFFSVLFVVLVHRDTTFKGSLSFSVDGMIKNAEAIYRERHIFFLTKLHKLNIQFTFFTRTSFYNAIKLDACFPKNNQKYEGLSLNRTKGKPEIVPYKKGESDCIGFFRAMFSPNVF